MTPEIGPFSYAKLHGLKIAHFPLPNYYDPQKDMLKDVAEMEHLVNKQGMETFLLDHAIYFSDFMHRFTYWSVLSQPIEPFVQASREPRNIVSAPVPPL